VALASHGHGKCDRACTASDRHIVHT
jgi:hypothetical protein